MMNFVKVLVGLMFGTFVLDFTVDKENFPFHAYMDGKREVVGLKRMGHNWYFATTGENALFVPSRFTFWQCVRIVAKLAFIGRCKNMYGGISIRLVTAKVPVIRILNALLARVGYVMVEREEHTKTRVVRNLLKAQNHNLKARVGELEARVGATEGLLSDFCTANAQHVVEKEIMEANVASLSANLDTANERIQSLEEKTDALCAALGIQTVDEFLESTLPIQLPLRGE